MLIDKMADKSVKKLLKHDVIKNDDSDVYYYGLQLLIGMVFKGIGLFLLALAFGCIPESAVYLFFFILLRTYSGGYHSKTYLNCFIATAASMLIVVRLAHTLSGFGFFILPAILLPSLVLVYLLAPVESENKPIPENKKAVLRKKSILIAAGESAAILFCSAASESFEVYCMTAALAIMTVSVSMTSGFFSKLLLSESNNYS